MLGCCTMVAVTGEVICNGVVVVGVVIFLSFDIWLIGPWKGCRCTPWWERLVEVGAVGIGVTALGERWRGPRAESTGGRRVGVSSPQIIWPLIVLLDVD